MVQRRTLNQWKKSRFWSNFLSIALQQPLALFRWSAFNFWKQKECLMQRRKMDPNQDLEELEIDSSALLNCARTSHITASFFNIKQLSPLFLKKRTIAVVECKTECVEIHSNNFCGLLFVKTRKNFSISQTSGKYRPMEASTCESTLLLLNSLTDWLTSIWQQTQRKLLHLPKAGQDFPDETRLPCAYLIIFQMQFADSTEEI